MQTQLKKNKMCSLASPQCSKIYSMDIPVLSHDKAKWEPLFKRLQKEANSHEGFMQVIEAYTQSVKNKGARTKAGEDECIREFRAHERGGHGGLQRLRRVYRTIMLHHSVPPERLAALLSFACIYNNKREKPSDKNGPSQTYF